MYLTNFSDYTLLSFLEIIKTKLYKGEMRRLIYNIKEYLFGNHVGITSIFKTEIGLKLSRIH